MSGAREIFSPERFAGKVVIVTGAVQGIGLAVARRLLRESGTVVLVDRSPLIHEVAESLRGLGGEPVALEVDLERYDSCADGYAQVVERFGRIDVLINNVGGTIWAKPFEHYAPDEIRAEIDRSLFTTLWSCRAALPYMIDAGRGVIVNVSSIATRSIHRVPYAAAKGGVNAITASLAMECAPKGVRVVATAPGGTQAPERRVRRGPEAKDEQERSWYQAIVDQTVDSSLMKRYGTLEEQVGPIVFLASDEASYVAGSVLPVGGGDQG
ncbi:1,6-dihydroxycyclohexa-2,4-diene-1-carboxylate dehydrogenase [Microtetraspora sp. NBRC 16547]|uniref:1,6-dihydroxycyclohexa-2,4-diene-1-carboxylate dehydrogenase n=1 Tax=Microtetraspora sp. NBRC 16547 TaxID=3030993 RepID=UPI0024A198F0|nr:1,6-dihydroxycyclohexa-2,4-diene-1-carboxylate dehydrogenase [Microtetraspora sp. NBRC 16547]GLW97810.1 1,6-dihydroxycyclohexa-2,4-diene-1-carboxylate dehydrogenase [Microtetraspora sp. NBRC 16547]